MAGTASWPVTIVNFPTLIPTNTPTITFTPTQTPNPWTPVPQFTALPIQTIQLVQNYWTLTPTFTPTITSTPTATPTIVVQISNPATPDLTKSTSASIQLTVMTDQKAVATQVAAGLTSSLFSTTNGPITFTGVGTPAAIPVTLTSAVQSWTVAAKKTGSVTSWTIVLEGSLDGTNFTTILSHTNVAPGDGMALSTGSGLAPYKIFQIRCSALSIGAGTNVIANALGMQ